jgi:hypothetical protein
MTATTNIYHPDSELLRRIQEVWSRYGADLGKLVFKDDAAHQAGHRIYVDVVPEQYPTSMIGFYDALARTEIDLRDEGKDVILRPAVKQRFLVVATLPDGREVAFHSRDGDEYEDLVRLMDLPNLPSPTMIEGYPYDNDDDLEHAKAEAISEHPKAEAISEHPKAVFPTES